MKKFKRKRNSQSWQKSPSEPYKSMVSTTDVGGENAPGSKANWKKNKPKTVQVSFIGAATSDSVLHGKVVTNGSDQAGQLLSLGNALFSHIADQQLPNWAESL